MKKNIINHKQTKQVIQEREDCYRTIFENTGTSIIFIEDDMTISMANMEFVRNTGYSLDEIIGRMKWTELVHPDELTRMLKQYRLRCEEQGKALSSYEFRYLTKTGDVHNALLNVKLVSGTKKSIVSLVDITERKKAEEALRESEKRYQKLSLIDDLTQLYNVRCFYDQLRAEINRANRYEQDLTLLLVDIDNFKEFNDTYGHIDGDQVLLRFGQVVKKCLRQTDSAYRYGGEEFTVILPMTTSEDGFVIAERIRTEFKKENFARSDGHLHITISIGLEQYKQNEDIKAFVKSVDHLMYKAKKEGKDRVCFEIKEIKI